MISDAYLYIIIEYQMCSTIFPTAQKCCDSQNLRTADVVAYIRLRRYMKGDWVLNKFQITNLYKNFFAVVLLHKKVVVFLQEAKK